MSSLRLLAGRTSSLLVRSHGTAATGSYHDPCCSKCMPKYDPGSRLGVGPGVAVIFALFGLATLINPVNNSDKDWAKE